MKLHIGCGVRDFGASWIHIDKEDYPHISSHDVTKLPYEDDSIDIIYSSHLIAYFDRDEIIPVLKEWKRVLKPGGILRIATPDFKAISKLYVKQKSCTLDNFLGPLYGKMNGVYHKTTYDFYSLFELLIKCGYKNPRKYNRHTTDHARHDDHSNAYLDGQLISLNVQCYA